MTKPSCEVKLNEQDVRNYRLMYEKIAGCDRKLYNILKRITGNTMKNELYEKWPNSTDNCRGELGTFWRA